MALRRGRYGGIAAGVGRLFAVPAVLLAGLAVAAGAETRRGLAGITLDASGSALSGVEIRVVPLTQGPGALPLVRALSDADGRFALAALAPGAYRVVAVKGGYSVVVGQVDTLLRNTIELVLRPASSATGPAAPTDGSWSLRLPRRDVLEERQFGPATDASSTRLAPAFAGPFGMNQFAVDLAGLLLDGGGDTGGLAVRAAAGFESSFGRVRAALSHRNESAGEVLDDASTGIRLRWLPESGDPARLLSVEVDALRREVDGLSLPGAPGDGTDLGATRWSVRDARESAGWSREIVADVLLAEVSDHQPAFASDVETGLVSLGARATVGRAWRERHVFSAGADVSGTRGAFDEGRPSSVVMLPVEIGGTGDDLADAVGDRVGLYVGDLWQALPTLAIATRARGEWARGYDGEFRAIPSVEARVTAGPGIVLRAEGGIVLGGGESGSPIGRVEVAGGRGPFLLTASVDRSVGPTSWQAEPAVEDLSRLVFGPDAVVDRVALALAARPSGGLGPISNVQLIAQRLEVDGDFAPRLPHDVAIVPLAYGGRAAVDRVSLEIGLHRIGSSLLVEWEELDQTAGSPILPRGAEGWDRRAVSIRQRVLVRGGTAAFVVLGAETTRLTGAADDAELRAELLERRRLSGGMSLTF